MKSRFFKITFFKNLIRKQWHLFACVGLVLLAAVRKSWNEPRSARPATAEPSELPTKKPSLETDEQPVIKFTEKAPTAAAAPETEAKMSWPNVFEKKVGLPVCPSLTEAEKAAFLQRFGKTAMDEKRKFGLPASIILASGLAQSFGGRRDLAKTGSNFFGLAAFENSISRLESGGRGYQKFATAWDSFRAHSLFVTELLKAEKRPAATDWRAWARLLASKNGYSSIQNWETTVVEIIESNDLAALDKK